MRSASAVALALLAVLSLVALGAAPAAGTVPPTDGDAIRSTPGPAAPEPATPGPHDTGVTDGYPRPSGEYADRNALRSGERPPALASVDANESVDGSVQGLERVDPKTVIVVEFTASGDAQFAVRSRFRVNTSNETAAFEDLARDVEQGRTSVGYSEALFQRFANASSRATGRPMAIEDARWTSEVRGDVGVIAFEFTWTNFSETNGKWVNVSDAFNTTDGTWFRSLEDGQRLILLPPDGYAVRGSPPDRGPRFSDGALVWDGPREFEPGYLQATYVREAAVTTTTTTPPPNQNGNQYFLLFGVGLLVLIVSVGAGGYFLAQQQAGDGQVPATGAAPPGDDAATTAVASEDVGATAPAESSAVDETAASGAAAGAAAGDEESENADETAEEGEDDEEVDLELLSDEERVERLLDRNGGRMKQANIVKETGWSNAKVSQLLSSMEEEDRIDKLRIGRENLITLPDEDVTDL